MGSVPLAAQATPKKQVANEFLTEIMLYSQIEIRNSASLLCLVS